MAVVELVPPGGLSDPTFFEKLVDTAASVRLSEGDLQTVVL